MRYRDPKKSDLFSMSLQKYFGLSDEETEFQIMDRFRTIGLLRAGQHNGLCNLVHDMDRYAFRCL